MSKTIRTLKRLADQHGFTVVLINEAQGCWRVYGNSTVDYWPDSPGQTAFRHGESSGRKMQTAIDVMNMAIKPMVIERPNSDSVNAKRSSSIGKAVIRGMSPADKAAFEKEQASHAERDVMWQDAALFDRQRAEYNAAIGLTSEQALGKMGDTSLPVPTKAPWANFNKETLPPGMAWSGPTKPEPNRLYLNGDWDTKIVGKVETDAEYAKRLESELAKVRAYAQELEKERDSTGQAYQKVRVDLDSMINAKKAVEGNNVWLGEQKQAIANELCDVQKNRNRLRDENQTLKTSVTVLDMANNDLIKQVNALSSSPDGHVASEAFKQRDAALVRELNANTQRDQWRNQYNDLVPKHTAMILERDRLTNGAVAQGKLIAERDKTITGMKDANVALKKRCTTLEETVREFQSRISKIEAAMK